MKTYVVGFLLISFLCSDQLAFSQSSGTEVVSVSAFVGSVGVPSVGGSSGSLRTGVRFSGIAYPNATMVLLKNSVEVARFQAGKEGYFTFLLPEQFNRNILYSLYAIDQFKERSLLINYPLVTQEGYVTHVENITFPPTVHIDKLEVKSGDYITISGYAAPLQKVIIQILQQNNIFRSYTATSALTGLYKLTIPLNGYTQGEYSLRVSSEENPQKYGHVKTFTLGNATILYGEATKNIPGDCNVDQKINIIDFSVSAFWYGKRNPPKCVDTNADGVINVIDFSILAYYWTS